MEPATDTRAHFCDACEVVFFTPTLTDMQLKRVYSGYRSDEYTQQRVIHEPGYAQTAPGLDDRNSEYFGMRREFYNFFLSDLKSFTGNVVDFGGGDGYFSSFVFPEAHVQIVEHDFESQGGNLERVLHDADFLFSAHTFEHLSRPRAVLTRLVHGLRPGTPVYLELPKGYPGSLRAQFESFEARRDRGEDLGWDELVVLHEHIIHYSGRSLDALMSKSGLTPQKFYAYPRDIFGARGVKSPPSSPD